MLPMTSSRTIVTLWLFLWRYHKLPCRDSTGNLSSRGSCLLQGSWRNHTHVLTKRQVYNGKKPFSVGSG